MTGRLTAIVFLAASASLLNAETGYDAWLRYPELDEQTKALYSRLPFEIVTTGNSPEILSGRDEVVRAITGLFGKVPHTALFSPRAMPS